jgi:hypothetical protein
MTVVDLGSAPGSWSQVAAKRVAPGGRLIALDLLPMEPLHGVEFIQGDFHEDAVLQRCPMPSTAARSTLYCRTWPPICRVSAWSIRRA